MMRRILLVVALAILAAQPACLSNAPQSAATVKPAPPPAGPPAADDSYMRRTAIKYDANPQSGDAVESALVWSEKYSRAVEKLALLQAENRDLEEKNTRLADQGAKLQAELAQSQKELGEANALLLEMRTDLDKWKQNVLGFREEMRRAQQAELDALTKVLKLLGGEVVAPASQPVEKEVAKREPGKPAN